MAWDFRWPYTGNLVADAKKGRIASSKYSQAILKIISSYFCESNSFVPFAQIVYYLLQFKQSPD